MRRCSAWTFASTCGQGMSCHDVIAGVGKSTVNFYLAVKATPLLIASIPQQTVPTSASSLSPGFPWGIRFLGNPTRPRYTPDRLLPKGETGTGYFVPLNHLATGIGVSAVRRGCNG